MQTALMTMLAFAALGIVAFVAYVVWLLHVLGKDAQ